MSVITDIDGLLDEATLLIEQGATEDAMNSIQQARAILEKVPYPPSADCSECRPDLHKECGCSRKCNAHRTAALR